MNTQSNDDNDGPDSPMRLIGNLAEEVGLEPKTIRYYEREGLLSPKRIGHVRIFEDRDIQRLRVIRFLRDFDVSLQRIKALLAKYEDLTVHTLPEEAKQEVRENLERQKQHIEKLQALWSRIAT